MIIEEFINNKLKEISDNLYIMILEDPSNYACGVKSGYKQALIDIQKILDNDNNAQ